MIYVFLFGILLGVINTCLFLSFSSFGDLHIEDEKNFSQIWLEMSKNVSVLRKRKFVIFRVRPKKSTRENSNPFYEEKF